MAGLWVVSRDCLEGSTSLGEFEDAPIYSEVGGCIGFRLANAYPLGDYHELG